MGCPCSHRSVLSVERCFAGAVSRRRGESNRRAHGSVCVIEYCPSCKKQRHTNVNGAHRETSGWYGCEKIHPEIETLLGDLEREREYRRSDEYISRRMWS